MSVSRLLPLVLLIAAAPAPQSVPPSLRDRLISDASAISPADLEFDRTTKSVRTGGGTTTKLSLVERWDGKKWTLLSIGGAKPTGTQRRDHERAAKAVPVPGYHRLALLLPAATTVETDAQGRIWWHVPVLPGGSVHTDSGDISQHLKADLRLARRGDSYFVDQMHITARESFKMNLLIKVTDFDQTIDYQPGSDGKPRLINQKSISKGTMFGFPGGETAQVTFVYR
jgi:hypothetical protein